MLVTGDSTLRIITSGPLSLMQGARRRNVQALGVCEGGSSDEYAYFWANYLLSNPEGSATIEVSLGPFEAEFSQYSVIAISGADLKCTLNHVLIQNWTTHQVFAGDRIRMRPNNCGVRAYIAIKHGFRTLKQFGSYSEVNKENFFPRQVVKNAELPYSSFVSETWINKSVPYSYMPDYQKDLVLRVIPSYQFTNFTDDVLDDFTKSTYVVTQNSDRMGYRLNGAPVEYRGVELLSEGIAFGSVQIPPNGQPIVLLTERQTIGGYPKIGCVVSEDCYQLAQRQPGQKVRFALLP